MVESQVYDTRTKVTTTDTRYFISSLPVDPEREGALRAKCLSSQQPVSSSQWEDAHHHWPLTVGCWLLKHFGRRPPNILNVLRLDRTLFGGISVKRKELTWDDDKLLRLMLAA